MTKVFLSFAGLVGFNVIPVMASVLLRYERAIVSLDTVIPFLLFAYKRWVLGWIALIILGLCEGLYGFRQGYPLFNLRTIVDVVPFVRFANPQLILVVVGAIVLFVMACWLSARMVMHNAEPRVTLVVLFLIAIPANLPAFAGFDSSEVNRLKVLGEPVFGGTAYNLFNLWRADTSEWGTHNDGDNFYPLKTVSASSMVWVNGVFSDKVLFIIVESWGRPTDETEYAASIEALVGNQNIEMIGEGLVKYDGGTVQGELRELCGIVPISYAFSSVPEHYADGCIPRRLVRQGYASVSLHAAHSGMYDRGRWYPTIGFHESYFYDRSLADVRKCKSFPGFCDVDLIPSVIQRILASEKIFLYWITLNSHLPYDPTDLSSDDQSECLRLKLADDSRCHQFLLIKDFFDHLNDGLSEPRLSGLEVVLVGDHNPPFVTFSPDRVRSLGVLGPGSNAFDSQFVSGKVPYIHFRVR